MSSAVGSSLESADEVSCVALRSVIVNTALHGKALDSLTHLIGAVELAAAVEDLKSARSVLNKQITLVVETHHGNRVGERAYLVVVLIQEVGYAAYADSLALGESLASYRRSKTILHGDSLERSSAVDNDFAVIFQARRGGVGRGGGAGGHRVVDFSACLGGHRYGVRSAVERSCALDGRSARSCGAAARAVGNKNLNCLTLRQFAVYSQSLVVGHGKSYSAGVALPGDGHAVGRLVVVLVYLRSDGACAGYEVGILLGAEVVGESNINLLHVLA